VFKSARLAAEQVP